MHPQLQAIAEALDDAADRAAGLVEGLSEGRFHRRPEGTRWSVEESLAHLTLTTAAFLPLIDGGIGRARELGRPAPPRFRRGLTGWLLEAAMEPPVRLKYRTSAPFQPPSGSTREAVLAAFQEGQAALRHRLEQMEGLDPTTVRVASPFNVRLRYNLYACLRILAAHQRRHLWQAEQAILQA